jgi:hypothetical protein
MQSLVPLPVPRLTRAPTAFVNGLCTLDSGILRPHGAVANGTASATSVSTASSFITTTSRLLFTGPSAVLTMPVPISACQYPSVLTSAYQSAPVLTSPHQCPSVTIQKGLRPGSAPIARSARQAFSSRCYLGRRPSGPSHGLIWLPALRNTTNTATYPPRL